MSFVVPWEHGWTHNLETSPCGRENVGQQGRDTARKISVYAPMSYRDRESLHVRDRLVQQRHERHSEEPDLEGNECDVLPLRVLHAERNAMMNFWSVYIMR